MPHAAESIAAARAAGLACGYVTNNASRSASAVVEHLLDLGIDATIDDVVTSPQAAVSLLPDYVPAGSRVLVIGGSGIDDALVAAGYLPVRTLADGPAAVMQGFSPDVSWRDLAEATFAVRSGLPWIATNPDLTFPAPGGIAPGNGALVRLVAETVGRGPDAVAGKPEPPLLHEAVRRTQAQRPLMVGDRLDTDIAAGTRIGIPSLLVFTGVTTLAELLAAVPDERPDVPGCRPSRARGGLPRRREHRGHGQLPGVLGAGRGWRIDGQHRRGPVGRRPCCCRPDLGGSGHRAVACGRRCPRRTGPGRGLTALPGDAAGPSRTGTVDPAAGTAPPHCQTKE